MQDIIENGGATPAPVQHPIAPANAVTPADLLRIAVDSGADLDRLEKLMTLQERWEADQARKAFADDMARFKLKPLVVMKDKYVEYGEGTKKTRYSHATIGNVVDVIVPQLAEFGFSHRWDLEQKEGQVIVTCVITHRLGHSQKTTLMAAPDASGGKNGIQSVISAKTYLERHTLLAATGAATRDQLDDDGMRAELDTTLADKWIGKAKAATALSVLNGIWAEGVAEISASGQKAAYEEFKAAVTARKKELAAEQKPEGDA
jgi:hypothetical protein